MNERLDFLVIGAQKCATSWLYYCLKDHPGLKLPARKKEVEYLGGDLYEQRGADWYFSLLDGAGEGQKKGAVSIEYMYDGRSAEVVRRLAPGVKLIASLRNPVHRAVSGYSWYMRKGLIPNLSLAESLKTALKEVRGRGNSSASPFAELLLRGIYDVQLQRYLDLFDHERFLVLLYEDIQNRPGETIEKIYRFLGVDPSFLPPSLNSRPKRNTYIKPLMALERFAGRSRTMGKAMDVINNAIASVGLNTGRPAIPVGLHGELEDFFAPHILNSQKIIDGLPPDSRPFSQDLMKSWFGKVS